jgi:hypothetical protein
MQAWGVLGPTDTGTPLSGTRQSSNHAGCLDEPAGRNTVATSSFRLPPDVAPSTAAGPSLAPVNVTFCFDGQVDGLPYPSLSASQQRKFETEFHRELDALAAWSSAANWAPLPVSEIRVFVSDEYKISRSLVPAALNARGKMEFPAWKAIAGEAAIAHELVHVYFPNGNRFLAEGLALFLQQKIGGNPAFPNFGRSLHDTVRELAREMVPEFTLGRPETLETIQFTDLDKIATPSPLRLRVGKYLYDNSPTGQAHIYPIVGSFIQFLIERHGLERFRTLFAHSPLIPFERNPGSADRWLDVYDLSLEDLQLQWRNVVADCSI